MSRPFRESERSTIDADYAEFMRRMYAEEDITPRPFMGKIILLSAGITVCIAIIIYQLS